MRSFLLVLLLLCPKVQSDDLLARFRANPRQKEIFRPLMEQLIRNQEYNKALDIAREILKIEPLNAFVMGKHAYLLLTVANRNEEARKAAQRTLNYFRDNVDALHTLGWWHYLQKDYVAALRHFREIRDPEIADFDLQYHWGLAAWKADQATMARSHFSRALKLNGEDLPLLLSIALFEESSGNPAKAIACYQRALTLAKDEGPVRDFILQKLKAMLPSYHAAKRPVRKMPAAKELPRPKPRPVASIKPTAPVTPSANPFLQPISRLNLLQDAEPLETLAQEQYHSLGEMMLATGLAEDAIAEFQTALSLNRKNPTAQSANTLIQQASRLPPLTMEARMEKLFSLTEDLFRQGNRIYARYVLQKMLLLQPQHRQARKNLAYIYLELNQPLSALPILKQLSEDYPYYQEALILYGYCLARLRRFREASDALGKALQGAGGRQFSDDYSKSLQDSIHAYEKPLPLLD